MTNWWFYLSIPVSSTNKTDRHDITELLLKVALNTINLNPNQSFISVSIHLVSEMYGFLCIFQTVKRSESIPGY